MYRSFFLGGSDDMLPRVAFSDWVGARSDFGLVRDLTGAERRGVAGEGDMIESHPPSSRK
jgi:hypothetical protein